MELETQKPLENWVLQKSHPSLHMHIILLSLPSSFCPVFGIFHGQKCSHHCSFYISTQWTIPDQSIMFNSCCISLGVKLDWLLLLQLFLLFQLKTTNTEEPCGANMALIAHHRTKFQKERQAEWYKEMI